jgi:dolichol-phosphate mannosyltransferase
MIEAIGEHDVVLGSRYVPGGSIPKDWGMQRKLISILGNQVAKLILTRKYKDFTSGFRMTRREHLQKAIENGFLSNHYAYKLHLLWALHVNGARVYEHPISFVDRVKGKSKLPANSIVDSLRVLLKLRLSKISKSINP